MECKCYGSYRRRCRLEREEFASPMGEKLAKLMEAEGFSLGQNSAPGLGQSHPQLDLLGGMSREEVEAWLRDHDPKTSRKNFALLVDHLLKLLPAELYEMPRSTRTKAIYDLVARVVLSPATYAQASLRRRYVNAEHLLNEFGVGVTYIIHDLYAQLV